MKFSERIKTSQSDEYYTLKYAVDLIVPYLKQKGYQRIACSFDKSHSQYVQVLRDEGFDVVYGHIETGQDFYKQFFDDIDCIVSNPPFSQRTAIIKRLFELGKPFAVLTNMNGLFDANVRFNLFKEHDFELLIPRGRMHFESQEKGVLSNPSFQTIYVCHNVLLKQIEFVEMGKNNV